MNDYHIYPFRFVGGVKNIHKMDSRDFLKSVGGNVGNLAFQYPLELLFGDRIRPFYNQLDYQDREVLIITAANWINEGKGKVALDDTFLSLVSSYKKVIIYGLGAQSEIGVSALEYSKKIHPSVVAVIKKLSSYVDLLGVRDDFTKELLILWGVENSVVLGCSSVLINPSPVLGSEIIARCSKLLEKKPDDLRITLNEYTHNPKSRTLNRRDFNANIDFIRNWGGHYCLQGRYAFPYFFNESEDLGSVIEDYLSDDNMRYLKAMIKDRTAFFSNVPDWIAYYKRRDFVTGTRIHGAILAITAGTPTVLIAHDSRTYGLAKVLGIPSVSAEFFYSNSPTPTQMLCICKEQLAEFDKVRASLAFRWVDCFNNVEIDISQHLTKLMSFYERAV